jgi:hypothetical protein
VMADSCSFTFGIWKNSAGDKSSGLEWWGITTGWPSPSHVFASWWEVLALILLTFGEAHVLVKYVVDQVPMEAPSPWKGAWYSPSGHLQRHQEQRPEGLCSDGFLGVERSLFYRNGTSSREWPTEMLFPDQSADLTRKIIKQKLTDICPFTKVILIAPLKNVLFLFYLHSLDWIWTHLVYSSGGNAVGPYKDHF